MTCVPACGSNLELSGLTGDRNRPPAGDPSLLHPYNCTEQADSGWTGRHEAGEKPQVNGTI